MNLYIAREGRSLGPFSESQAREHLRAGYFGPEELGCVEGGQDWLPLSHLLRPQIARIVPPPPPAARVAAMPPPAGERILFRKGPIMVTSTTFLLGETMYAVRNISSVSFHTKPAQRGAALLVVSLGMAMAASVLFREDFGGLARLGGVMVVLGILSYHFQRTTYTLLLTTNAGQVRALSDRSRRLIMQVGTALQEAMAVQA